MRKIAEIAIQQKRKLKVIFAAILIIAALMAVAPCQTEPVNEYAQLRSIRTEAEETNAELIYLTNLSAESKTAETEAVETAVPTTEPPSYFEVHYIDVGQGDCSLILCDGHAMLIDGGNKKQSSKVYSYLEKRELTYLDYIVCTHPDSDHAGGLSGALINTAVGTALSNAADSDEAAFQNFVKYLAEQGVEISVPTAGETFKLGSAEFEIIAPVDDSGSDNNRSLVIRIVYGNTSFLFTGDAEEAEENSILNTGKDINSTVLKVAHHGSGTSTCDSFLNAVQPEYCIISVGKDNLYFHPSEAVIERLKAINTALYRTDLQGTIIVSSDGEKITVQTERNADEDTFVFPIAASETAVPETTPINPAPTAPATTSPTPTDTPETPAVTHPYVLNTNSLKFHYTHCSAVRKIKASNRCDVDCTREEVIAMGYSSCGICHP